MAGLASQVPSLLLLDDATLLSEPPSSSHIFVSVQIPSCKSLPCSDIGIGRTPSSDPFVKIKLVDVKRRVESKEAETQPRFRTVNPTWVPACHFNFWVEKEVIDDVRILVTVYDHDTLSSHDYLGSATLPLTSVELTLDWSPTMHSLGLVNSQTGESIPDCASVQLAVNKSESREGLIVNQIVFEYERWTPTGGWGHKYPGHLLPTDPGCWSTKGKEKWGMELKDIEGTLNPGDNTGEYEYKFQLWVLPGDITDASQSSGWKLAMILGRKAGVKRGDNSFFVGGGSGAERLVL